MKKIIFSLLLLTLFTFISCKSNNHDTTNQTTTQTDYISTTTKQQEITSKQNNNIEENTFLTEDKVVIKYDINNDGETEDIILSEEKDSSDIRHIMLTIEKNGTKMLCYEINGNGSSGSAILDVCSLYIVEIEKKNYILSFYNLGYGSVYEVYSLYSIDHNGALELKESKDFGFGYTEYGTFGYSEENIDEIDDFYRSISTYLENAKLIFDVDRNYYSYFIYSTSEKDWKTYKDAKNKIVGFLGEAPYDITKLNSAMKDSGYPEYIVSNDDSFKTTLTKLHHALKIFENQ